ncbi:MAG: PilW family protein [Hydrogenophaga sp.]|uniref:PilW family protein n=1 Tax=Hydrogenophaga sp. TaxID=1904254 RepID=UPI0025BF4573|nr:PilW family protein [Hydrogenophaga sp.]MBU7572272.1 PilW family protein [Hydrogenophaga sp.]
MTTSRQSGASLVELMIALAVGLMVVIAAMGSLVYTRTASQVMGDSTRLQQDAATAFRVIGQVVRQAGARRLLDMPGSTVSFNPQYKGIEVNVNTWQPAAVKGTDGALNRPDTLALARDHTLASGADKKSPLNIDNVDCLGQPTAPGQNVTSTFSVDAGELKCKGSGSSEGSYGLMASVEDFQVWYGLREGAGLRYTTATALNQFSPAPWDQVEALRVCLRLAGELSSGLVATTVGCQGEPTPNDGRLRRVFFRVFKLRNASL